METAIQPGTPAPQAPPEAVSATRKKSKNPLWQILEFAASLRVTVVLFAMSLVLVFFGTWAQVDSGIWDVVNRYFRSLVAWIPIKVLTFYALPQDWAINKFAIPYPGGWLLGGALLTNLLAAHFVRFKLSWKRSGILILHSGLILMMLGEFFTGVYAVEGMMTIAQGETVNYVQDNRSFELAIVDVTDPKRKEDDIVAVYLPAIERKTITDAELPFHLEVREFMKNSDLREREANDPDNGVDSGIGRRYTAIPLPEVSGADPDQKVDLPTAIVTLKSKDDGEPIGTYMLSFIFNKADTVTVGDKTYEISLRPKRTYRDFTVYLEKAEERKHPNLQMAKDFSSFIVLNDPSNDVEDRKVHIWMNHPMRYRGEAFFQANMHTMADGTMVTGLQVVKNEVAGLPFWMLPYASCIVVAIGMMMHFGVNLYSFLGTQSRSTR